MGQIDNRGQLDGVRAERMSLVAEKWFGYYYRPLIFPDQYFKTFKPSIKYRMLQKQLPKMYDEFLKVFVSSCCNEQTLGCFNELALKMDKVSADAFFVQVFYFVKYALSNSDAVLALKQATTVPLAGRLVAVLEGASNKEMQTKFVKVEQFLHMLFLDTYPQWFKECSLNGI